MIFPFTMKFLPRLVRLAGVGAVLASAVCVATEQSSLAPHLLLAPLDFDRINALARAEPWAEKVRADLIHAA